MSRHNFLLSQGALLAVALVLIAFALQGDISFQGFIGNIEELKIILMFFAPVGMFFQFTCAYRRLHDINQHGLWALLIFSSLTLIPFVGAAFLIYISYKKGDETPNRYGNPDTDTFVDSILNKSQRI
ncbi:MAG: uncharacterized membrane protein YhaH (DUF805 family) [Acidimicrobiales bacterium]|jgi:uncharacterized membrane protein YhaH (DUF805 family)